MNTTCVHACLRVFMSFPCTCAFTSTLCTEHIYNI